METVPDTDSNS